MLREEIKIACEIMLQSFADFGPFYSTVMVTNNVNFPPYKQNQK